MRVALPEVRVLAAAKAVPHGILTGRAALCAVAGWHLGNGPIEVLARVRWTDPGLKALNYRIDPDWVCVSDDLRCTVPAASVAYLAGYDNGEAIDEYLRLGGNLGEVRSAAALMTRWRHHAERVAVLEASRDLPWSQAERLFHRILRNGGITGWQANVPVRIGARTYVLDVAFKVRRLAFEIDGFAFHSAAATFVADRERRNALLLAGWQVYNFTWAALQDEASVLRTVRDALRARPVAA